MRVLSLQGVPALMIRSRSRKRRGNLINSQSFNHAFSIGSTVVSVNPKYYRPTEVARPYGNLLIGDPTKAKQQLGWEAS